MLTRVKQQQQRTQRRVNARMGRRSVPSLNNVRYQLFVQAVTAVLRPGGAKEQHVPRVATIAVVPLELCAPAPASHQIYSNLYSNLDQQLQPLGFGIEYSQFPLYSLLASMHSPVEYRFVSASSKVTITHMAVWMNDFFRATHKAVDCIWNNAHSDIPGMNLDMAVHSTTQAVQALHVFNDYRTRYCGLLQKGCNLSTFLVYTVYTPTYQSLTCTHN